MNKIVKTFRKSKISRKCVKFRKSRKSTKSKKIRDSINQIYREKLGSRENWKNLANFNDQQTLQIKKT